MNVWLEVLVYAAAGIALVGTLVLLAKDEVAGDPMFVVLAVVELLLVVQLVVGSVALAQTSREVSGVLFVSYLVGIALALPVGAFWSLAERSRAGTAVLAVAVFTVIGLELRLDAIWAGAGA
ncbi:MAG TPA: hypothetical protein VEW93_12730 [Acidimicrobiales bacterium]|nr:hypothetical protein [Acidimicrobiales bacterium]